MVTATPEKDAEKFEAWKYGENNMFGAILEIANSIFLVHPIYHIPMIKSRS
jgi:hypothetical protein